MNSIQVSIVIVCMNNLKNLYPCLNSIRKNTTVSCETLVVAYLFSRENLEMVKHDFPWVTFIESNEIRGFSENNNLALRQAKGKYCFVVNDDTEMKMPVIDKLVEDFNKCSERTAIISPELLDGNGNVAVCGRPPITWKTKIRIMFKLYNEKKDTKYSNKKGLFKTYNIIGAAFLIRRDLFEQIGWFDEYYFFAPEDLALSTLLNKMNYECYVDEQAKIIHYEGMSGKSLSRIKTATLPAMCKGGLHFYSEGKLHIKLIFGITYYLYNFVQLIYHSIKARKSKIPNIYSILAEGERNVLSTLFSKKTPKEIFTHYYYKQKNK